LVQTTQEKYFGGHFSIFAGFWNKFTFKIGCFTLTFRVTLLKRLNLKTLQFKIINFKNMCEFFREKSQIVVLSTFDQREFKKINYFDKNVYSVRERAFFTLSRTLLCVIFKIFSKKKFKFIKSSFVNNLGLERSGLRFENFCS